MNFNIKSFLNHYQAYLIEQGSAKQVFGAVTDLSRDFAKVVDHPENMDEFALLKEYLLEEGINVSFETFNEAFKGVSPSKLYKVMTHGLDFQPNMHLERKSDDLLKISLTYADEFINFSTTEYLEISDRSINYYSLFILDPESRLPFRSGVGSQFLSNNFTLYDQIGIEKVYVTKPVELGIRLWPRVGLGFEESFFKEQVKPTVMNYLDQDNEEQRELLTSLMEEHGAHFLTKLFQQDSFTYNCLMSHLDKSVDLQYYAEVNNKEHKQNFDDYFVRKNVKKLEMNKL